MKQIEANHNVLSLKIYRQLLMYLVLDFRFLPSSICILAILRLRGRFWIKQIMKRRMQNIQESPLNINTGTSTLLMILSSKKKKFSNSAHRKLELFHSCLFDIIISMGLYFYVHFLMLFSIYSRKMIYLETYTNFFNRNYLYPKPTLLCIYFLIEVL